MARLKFSSSQDHAEKKLNFEAIIQNMFYMSVMNSCLKIFSNVPLLQTLCSVRILNRALSRINRSEQSRLSKK